MKTPEITQEEVFFAGLAIELYRIVAREMKRTEDQAEALATAFEEIYRRTDFHNDRIVASEDTDLSIPRDELNRVLIAIAFGNFLAHRGIQLSDKLLTADH